MTADLTHALEVSKYCSREVLGVRRNEPKETELFKILNKFMILYVLGDDDCLAELQTAEINALTGALILHT
jgi:hypothetical protein